MRDSEKSPRRESEPDPDFDPVLLTKISNRRAGKVRAGNKSSGAGADDDFESAPYSPSSEITREK